MNKVFITLFLAFLSLNVSAQKIGLGLRGGDPSGLTVKKYMGGKALEFNLGRTGVWYGHGWYDDRFNDWYIDQKFDYEYYEYTGFHGAAPVSIQLHYLVQKDLSHFLGENTPGLEWYLGAGGQLRSWNYGYDYRYKLKGDPNWHYVTDSHVHNIDLGPDGVLGVEYTFSELPISVFADLTLFVEVVDDPLALWTQGGAGVRYNFSASGKGKGKGTTL